MTPERALENMINIAGSKADLARMLHVGRAAVQQWHKVPERHVWKIAREFGVAPEDVRPDLSEWRLTLLKSRYEDHT